MADETQKDLDTLCRGHQTIDALRLEIEAIAGQGHAPETLFAIWHGRNGHDGLRRKVAEVLSSVYPDDAVRYNACVDTTCRALWRLLNNRQP